MPTLINSWDPFQLNQGLHFSPNKDRIALFQPPHKLRWISWPAHQENRFQSQPKTSFAPIPSRHYSLSLSTMAFDHHYSITTVLSTTISTTSNHLTTSRGGYTTSPSPFYSFFLFFFFLSPTPPQGTSPSTALCQTSDDSRDPWARWAPFPLLFLFFSSSSSLCVHNVNCRQKL